MNACTAAFQQLALLAGETCDGGIAGAHQLQQLSSQQRADNPVEQVVLEDLRQRIALLICLRLVFTRRRSDTAREKAQRRHAPGIRLATTMIAAVNSAITSEANESPFRTDMALR